MVGETVESPPKSVILYRYCSVQIDNILSQSVEEYAFTLLPNPKTKLQLQI